VHITCVPVEFAASWVRDNPNLHKLSSNTVSEYLSSTQESSMRGSYPTLSLAVQDRRLSINKASFSQSNSQEFDACDDWVAVDEGPRSSQPQSGRPKPQITHSYPPRASQGGSDYDHLSYPSSSQNSAGSAPQPAASVKKGKGKDKSSSGSWSAKSNSDFLPALDALLGPVDSAYALKELGLREYLRAQDQSIAQLEKNIIERSQALASIEETLREARERHEQQEEAPPSPQGQHAVFLSFPLPNPRSSLLVQTIIPPLSEYDRRDLVTLQEETRDNHRNLIRVLENQRRENLDHWRLRCEKVEECKKLEGEPAAAPVRRSSRKVY